MTDCVICMRTLTPPVKVLECGHSFCQLCTSGLIGANNCRTNNGFVTINCPICRRPTFLYGGRIHLLPTNYALNILLEKRRNVRIINENRINGANNSTAVRNADNQINDEVQAQLVCPVSDEENERRDTSPFGHTRCLRSCRENRSFWSLI